MADTLPLIPSITRTALVLIDLQMFTVEHPMRPRSGRDILANAVRLADACRAADMLVVLVRAGGGAIRLTPPVDAGYPPMNFPANAHDFPAELGPKDGDVVVTKYNLGAFYCTDLDAQLRRRGIDTILLGGMTTAFGVEGTARQAHERAYAQVFVSDAIAGFTDAEHDSAMQIVLPRLGRVRTTDELISAISH
jgi:nicotinamidase-related amidase